MTATSAMPGYTVLRGDGISIVLSQPEVGLPTILHWGRDLGPLTDGDLADLAAAVSRQTPPQTLDAAWQVSILPQESDGWVGRPGGLLVRDGIPVFPRFVVTSVESTERSITLVAADGAAGLRFTFAAAIGAGGIVTVKHTIENIARFDGDDSDLEVGWLEATMPAPKAIDHLTSFSGRWTREKVPHTTPIPRGSNVRQTRRGRSGHDSPTLLIGSIGSPTDRTGELWGVHLGWSADATYRTDRQHDSVTILGAGELLRPGEITIPPGGSYETPVAYFAWTDGGFDGLSARFHAFLRARPQHPVTPRPLVLNTWEAVYFDHDPDFLLELAALAAQVGVERFVLDDGWFPSRRDDTKGLGDWVVDTTVWPQGLRPLADRVHGLGMEFGLWFEPEMVNLDSRVAQDHPEWLLHNPAHVPAPAELSWRSQYVLDIANPAAYAHVFGQISALVTELGIDFIKWDNNRDLVESMHAGRPGTHAQITALYRLIGELKAAHPGLEIESCSSGGARTDFGILEVTDRVWASDSNDPIERQDIQRWTQLMLAPELVGGHVGPTRSHSSGRVTDLSFRLATSLMGSAGFEWNISECTPDELETITRWAALYKELRPIIHGGVAVHADLRDAALRLTGAVSPDHTQAVYTVASLATLEDSQPEHVRLHGLDPDRRYLVRLRDEIGPTRHGFTTPEWMSRKTIVLPGRVLSTVGLQTPALWPAQAFVLHVTAVDEEG
ncbi:MAG TPA: alpha-galactosidase [Lacisediminihabitans sp.]|uniref:alpha-galactosidase n=1 Tax=Lacisediminihabitans sp. TaxID=2787631 RepID=UPI002EDB3419